MKIIHYILIFVILVGAGFGIYILKEKKEKEKKTNENHLQNNTKNIPASKPTGNYKYIYPEYFKKSETEIYNLQKSLNNVLRLNGKALIETDGLYGPETEKALIYYISVKNNLPTSAPIKDDNNNTWVINFDKVGDKIYQIGKDVTGITLLRHLFGYNE